jgi:hypothetical protein
MADNRGQALGARSRTDNLQQDVENLQRLHAFLVHVHKFRLKSPLATEDS